MIIKARNIGEKKAIRTLKYLEKINAKLTKKERDLKLEAVQNSKHEITLIKENTFIDKECALCGADVRLTLNAFENLSDEEFICLGCYRRRESEIRKKITLAANELGYEIRHMELTRRKKK